MTNEAAEAAYNQGKLEQKLENLDLTLKNLSTTFAEFTRMVTENFVTKTQFTNLEQSVYESLRGKVSNERYWIVEKIFFTVASLVVLTITGLVLNMALGKCGLGKC